MRRAVATALLLLGPLPAAAEEREALPSLELLDYLADFEEDADGRLIDPMESLAEAPDDRPDAPQPPRRSPER
ncbi:MAG TPA: hypothetical protein ENJ94_09000 [Gammaproteobacteria bacterium]|nr:hypothetical protein [Gammaproteobacteria bacterium]